ncbi:MAG: hypothetical protein WBM08_07280, partial [Prochlorococcaceae cyanobacterium]
MASKKVLTDLDFLSISRLLNVPLPVDAGDAVNKAYIDNLALQIAQALQGLSWKEDVVVAADANITLATPGATIDGETIAEGDRVLLMAQTAPAENGIYALTAGALVRTTDADSGEELQAAVVSVAKGSYAGQSFRQSEVDVTIDTDPNEWVPFHVATP